MGFNALLDISILISRISLTIPVVIYLVSIRRVPPYIHAIGILVCVSGVSELTSSVLIYNGQAHIVPLIHNTYAFTQFCLLSVFYNEILLKKSEKKYIIGMLIHSIFSVVVGYFFVQNIFAYQGLTRATISVVLTIYSILYFKKTFLLPENERHLASGTLWINAGIFLYFGLGILIFTMRDHLANAASLSALDLLWIFHNSDNSLKNLLFAKGIKESGKQNTLPSVTVEKDIPSTL